MTRLLTAREVAEVIGVNSETILRWTRCLVIPGFRLPGGALRYRESELLSAMRRSRRTFAQIRAQTTLQR